MKHKFLKLTGFLGATFLLFMIGSCVKTTSNFTDLSEISDMVILTNSGLQNFKASNILVNTSSPDTIKLSVRANLASAKSDNGPVTVTLGLDNAAITAYNAANGTNFQPFPANAYKFVSNTVTIPGGLEHYASTTVWVFQNKLDPSISYMLPVAITDGGGKSLSSNQNVIYFNVIGNPLAGNYLMDFYRWNGTTDTTTAANGGFFTNEPVVVPPITATSVLLPEDYLETFVGVGATLSFTNTSGVLSNFSVGLDAASSAAITTAGFTVVTAPTLVSYKIVGNASTKYAGSTFRIYTVVLNSAGATRTLIDNFVKQ
jgi:BT_3987-like, N-terminal domain